MESRTRRHRHVHRRQRGGCAHLTCKYARGCVTHRIIRSDADVIKAEHDTAAPHHDVLVVVVGVAASE